MKTTAIIIMLIGTMLAQNTYEVQPGTKGNEIKLTVANVSETNAATNVSITLIKKSSSLTFSQETEMIEQIEAKAEAEVNFTFDVGRNISANKKDTIEFKITSSDGIMMTKQFIFSYTRPKEFELEQNYPNPFNPNTKIRYSIPRSTEYYSVLQNVTLKIYDILGNEVVTLVNEQKEPGYYEAEFNASSISRRIASGVYICRLQSGNFISTKKMMVIK